MVKNINMQNVDELSIKYVLNELDPSEVHMIEEAMANDENILIEIESLRSTFRKLQKLPTANAPDSVISGVLEAAAAEITKRKQIERNKKMRYAGYLAAAAVTIVLGSGMALSWISNTSIQNEQANVLSQPAENTIIQQHQIAGPGIMSTQLNNPNVAEEPVEPWVDNRNMLRINIVNGSGGFSIMNPGLENETTGQLRPVDPNISNPSYPVMRDIQLTRTQN
jgi:anti-sigma factor RsiW